MKVTFYIEDGYAGAARPHYVSIPDEELADCMTVDDQDALIDSYVREHFETRIFPTWDRKQLEKCPTPLAEGDDE